MEGEIDETRNFSDEYRIKKQNERIARRKRQEIRYKNRFRNLKEKPIHDGAYVWFVTGYERGDDYTAFCYGTTDEKDAKRFIESEQKKWTEGFETHALLWRCRLCLWSGEKILWGIYSVEEQKWLTNFSVNESETIFFDSEVLFKAPYATPNTGIFVCPMTVKSGKKYFLSEEEVDEAFGT